MPSGTVTFLFTDIVDSSRLWDQHPLQMRVALEQHDALLAAAIESNQGYVFTTAGDSFAAAFQTADAAAQAALDIQTAIGDNTWDVVTPIRVRIGVHTGEAHERGGDYFGPAVNRAARIEAAGHGGQILVSGVTAWVLGGSTLVEWDLTALGEHPLEGLDEPEHLHQIGTDEFPELRGAASERTNLPAGQSALIGRDDEIIHILDLCRSERLVTLTGLGGIGKTSLALEVAHQLNATGDDGAWWWCDLITSKPDEVARTISKAVGLETGAEDPQELAALLRRRGPIRIVLDNCEHVIRAVGEVTTSLLDGSDVQILATSRIPIGLLREALVPVTPLDVASASVELFERAMIRVGVPPPDPTEEVVVSAVCERLAGIPLAIELVAARTRVLGLEDIQIRLEHLLSSPAAGTETLDDRHRTMTAAIAWSVELLDVDLCDGLGALAVFSNGFDLESAEAMLSLEGADALAAVEAYVAGSLLEVDRSGHAIRYRMLEPIRQYAEQHLWVDPARTRHGHLEFFLNRLERAYEALGTHSSRKYLALRSDMVDLHACHQWALESGRIDDALRLYGPLASSWMDLGDQVYGWSADTVAIEGIEGRDGWGAVWMVHASATVSEAKYEDELIKVIADFEKVSADDPTREMALRGRANILGVFTGRDWAGAVSVYELPPPRDTMALLNHYFFGGVTLAMAPAEVTGLTAAESIDRSIERFYEGLGWATSIGASNFEASLLQIAANVLVRAGRFEQGLDHALRAEELADALGMATTRDLSRYHQVVAALSGTDIGRDPFELLVRTLESVLQTGHQPTGAYLAKPAGRYLAQAGRFDTAALCMLQPDVGFPDLLPPLGIELLPDAAWEAARLEAPRMEILDVVELALIELRTLDDPVILREP